MSYQSVITPLTAQNATETVKTAISSPVTVPQGVSKVIAITPSIAMAGLTTLEGVSGFFEVESNNIKPWNGTQQFVLPQIMPLTSGVAVIPRQPILCDIPVTPNGTFTISTTFDTALTVNPSMRYQVEFE
jgi:hypothetical protein